MYHPPFTQLCKLEIIPDIPSPLIGPAKFASWMSSLCHPAPNPPLPPHSSLPWTTVTLSNVSPSSKASGSSQVSPGWCSDWLVALLEQNSKALSDPGLPTSLASFYPALWHIFLSFLSLSSEYHPPTYAHANLYLTPLLPEIIIQTLFSQRNVLWFPLGVGATVTHPPLKHIFTHSTYHSLSFN